MAIVLSEGFDAYAASADLANNWDFVALGAGISWNSTAGRLGGGAAVLAAGTAALQAQQTDQFAIGSSTPMGLAFWFKCTAAPSSLASFLGTFATGNTQLSVLRLNTDGTLHLASGDLNGRANGSTNVCDGQWHWIEEYNVAQNNGVYKCWVDGIVQWNTGISWSTAGTRTSLALYRVPTGTITIDDIFVVNDTSPSPTATDMPIGQRVISTLYPNADSAVQFTRSAGSDNYALVDDVGADGDTTYVEDGTSGHADEYDFTNMGFSPVTISGVQIVGRMKNSGAGTISTKLRAHSGATTSDGSSISLSSNYRNYRRCLTQNPDGSVAWTQTTVDAAKFGLTVV